MSISLFFSFLKGLHLSAIDPDWSSYVSKIIPEIANVNSLPDWISPEITQNLSIVALVVLGILLFLVLRFISKVLVKFTFIVIILALAFGVWTERSLTLATVRYLGRKFTFRKAKTHSVMNLKS